MPKFSNQLLQGLINPTYGDSLNKAGMLLGAAPGRAKAVATQKDNLTQVMGSISTAMQAAQNGDIASAQQAQAAASALLPTLSPQNQQVAGQQLKQLNSTLATALPVKRAADKEAEALALLEAQKQAGLKVATTRGEQSAIEALNSGSISGADYLKGIYEAQSKLTTVGDGSRLIRGAGTDKEEILVSPATSPMSPEGKQAYDLGLGVGTPESKAFIKHQTGIKKEPPLSEIGKRVVDSGTPRTDPNFANEVKKMLEPAAWKQYTDVSNTITSATVFKSLEEDEINGNKAQSLLNSAESGNVKSIPLLESSIATLVRSSQRAASEIDRIKRSNDIAGGILDRISTGVVGTLTQDTLDEYGDLIQQVIEAGAAGKAEFVDRKLKAAEASGIPPEVILNLRDSFAVKPRQKPMSEIEVGDMFDGHIYRGGPKAKSSSWELPK